MRRSWLRLFWAGVLVVAAGVGYLVSSGLGERLLHREIEFQLARLLSGPVTIDRVDVRLAAGIEIEAFGIEAYPSSRADHPPALRARRVLAGLDSLALLIGRLKLASLVIEGPHLRIERNEAGDFADLPLPRLPRFEDAPESATPGETALLRLESLDASTAALLDELRLADRFEIRDGTIQWIDHRIPTAESRPSELRLELVNGTLDRDWLSEAVAIEWNAVWVDGLHAPFPFAGHLRREEGADFEWALSASDVPLDLAGPPLDLAPGIEDLSGHLSFEAKLAREPDAQRQLDLKGEIRDATIGLRRSHSTLEREQIEWSAAIRFDHDHIRLTLAHIQGKRLGIDLKGAIDRPLAPSSRVRLESRMMGVGFEEIRELARSLEGESEAALAVSKLTERVEDGRIAYIEAAGTTRLEHWQALATGRSAELPEGFVLGGAFDRITVETDPDDRLEDLSGEAEWSGDQITLRNLNGFFRGRPLPLLNAVLDGVSHLARSREGMLEPAKPPPPLPGVAPLLELLKPRDPDALPPVRAVGLALDRLDHPLLRYPMRDLRLYIEPLRRGLEVNVREGLWGEASMEGEVVLFNDPVAPSVSASIVLGPPPEGPPRARAPAALASGPEEHEPPTIDLESTAAPKSPDAARASTDWASGRFEIEFRPRPRLPFQRATGFFRLDAGDLKLTEVEAVVDEGGQAAARAVLDLTQTETVGIDLSFALTEGHLARLCPMLGLSDGLATGSINATGSFQGALRPGRLIISEVEGKVRAEARDGNVRTEVPLMLRLSKATEGYNPFANEHELQYESMAATILFDQGELTTDDFEIEGPLRVFATARIDTNQSPSDIRAVVGIFLFRAPNQFLESLPLVRSFLPGSDRGLIGAYFEVEGPLAEPDVETLALKSLMSGVPDALKAPFKVLRFLFNRPKEAS